MNNGEIRRRLENCRADHPQVEHEPQYGPYMVPMDIRAYSVCAEYSLAFDPHRTEYTIPSRGA